MVQGETQKLKWWNEK